MSQLTLQLTDDFAKDLATVSRQRNLSPEDYIRDVVRRDITIQKLRDAREKLLPYAKNGGYASEDELMQDIS